MELGAFSVSLAVSDLAASRAFYQALGFEIFGGDEAMNYLIMRNGDSTIGLFHGMFEGNILTFNPGWDANASAVDEFDDVRTIQQQLESAGLTLDASIGDDDTGSGPASIALTDPDGNVILIDQHV
ncbi:MAG: VOC family protein [Acidimicrobiia bacterium]|nr:VOC family protein [Acidimicrobiia bacterium]